MARGGREELELGEDPGVWCRCLYEAREKKSFGQTRGPGASVEGGKGEDELGKDPGGPGAELRVAEGAGCSTTLKQ